MPTHGVHEDNIAAYIEAGAWGVGVVTPLFVPDDIINERYASGGWNIYAAQASDGDNWETDSPICRELLVQKLVPLVELLPEHPLVVVHRDLLQDDVKRVEGLNGHLAPAI